MFFKSKLKHPLPKKTSSLGLDLKHNFSYLNSFDLDLNRNFYPKSQTKTSQSLANGRNKGGYFMR